MVVVAAGLSGLTTVAQGQSIQTSTPNAAGAGFLSPTPFANRSYINWSDLPFTVSATQSLGYNDNILGVAQGQALPAGTSSRGDFFSTTTLGLSTTANVGFQQLFFDGTFGFTRYREDAADNVRQYSLDGGVNWNVTSRCSGRLVLAKSEQQSPLEQQVGAGINNVDLASINEMGKCQISGYISAIANAGATSSRNSSILNQFNNSDSETVTGGFQYSVPGLNTVSALVTYTRLQFTDRGAAGVPSLGLASGTDQVDYKVDVNRQLTPNIYVDVSGGISQITTLSSSSATASQTIFAPVYSASVSWQATPKLTVLLSSGRSVGAPTTVVANSETSDSETGSFTYQFTPKISVQSGIARASSSGGQGTPVPGVPGGFIGSGGVTWTAYWKALYSISPFVVATASYNHSDRNSFGIETKNSIFMLGLTYKPQ